MAAERSAATATARALGERLAAGRPLVLDGALGTEIERRGARCDLPLWSTHALIEQPALVLAIHRDYVDAGAEVLTAATFRTQRRTLARAGLEARDAGLTAHAVELARRAADEAQAGRARRLENGGSGARRVFVAGSVAPLEDCYQPARVPDAEALAREHAAHVRHLVAAGVDLVLVETMNTIREARAALRAALEAGAPTWLSFACGPGGRLLSGEPLAEAVSAVIELGPQALLVNCLPARDVEACLAVLASSPLPFGVYANLGAPDPQGGFRSSDACTPESFAASAEQWVRAGARIVGGCCGTTPAHIRAIAEQLGP